MKPTSTVTSGTQAKLLREYAKAYNIDADYSLRFIANKEKLAREINEVFAAEMDQSSELEEIKPSVPTTVFKGKTIKTAIAFISKYFKVDTLTEYRGRRCKYTHHYWMVTTDKGLRFIRKYPEALYFMKEFNLSVR